ncbi:hypothetical protein BgiMline_030588 [Biomphalaria glabrata]
MFRGLAYSIEICFSKRKDHLCQLNKFQSENVHLDTSVDPFDSYKSLYQLLYNSLNSVGDWRVSCSLQPRDKLWSLVSACTNLEGSRLLDNKPTFDRGLKWLSSLIKPPAISRPMVEGSTTFDIF